MCSASCLRAFTCRTNYSSLMINHLRSTKRKQMNTIIGKISIPHLHAFYTLFKPGISAHLQIKLGYSNTSIIIWTIRFLWLHWVYESKFIQRKDKCRFNRFQNLQFKSASVHISWRLSFKKHHFEHCDQSSWLSLLAAQIGRQTKLTGAV